MSCGHRHRRNEGGGDCERGKVLSLLIDEVLWPLLPHMNIYGVAHRGRYERFRLVDADSVRFAMVNFVLFNHGNTEHNTPSQLGELALYGSTRDNATSLRARGLPSNTAIP